MWPPSAPPRGQPARAHQGLSIIVAKRLRCCAWLNGTGQPAAHAGGAAQRAVQPVRLTISMRSAHRGPPRDQTTRWRRRTRPHWRRWRVTQLVLRAAARNIRLRLPVGKDSRQRSSSVRPAPGPTREDVAQSAPRNHLWPVRLVGAVGVPRAWVVAARTSEHLLLGHRHAGGDAGLVVGSLSSGSYRAGEQRLVDGGQFGVCAAQARRIRHRDRQIWRAQASTPRSWRRGRRARRGGRLPHGAACSPWADRDLHHSW